MRKQIDPIGIRKAPRPRVTQQMLAAAEAEVNEVFYKVKRAVMSNDPAVQREFFVKHAARELLEQKCTRRIKENDREIVIEPHNGADWGLVTKAFDKAYPDMDPTNDDYPHEAVKSPGRYQRYVNDLKKKR
jgi:hypothetical protein